jgi:hypothetical protein
MRYRVFWTPDAENDLATLWLDAADRDEIARVSNQIDNLLGEDAHLQGELREEISRVLILLPFVVEFDVVEVGQAVFVTGFWKTSNR